MPPGDGGEHLPAHLNFAVPEGRRGDVEQEGRALAHQVFDGVGRIQTVGPEILVVPGVFADGDGQPFAFKIDYALARCRGEVALLVEDVVKGQEHLVLL